MRKALLALALSLGLAGVVWSQPVIQQTFSGNEVWPCSQGPGGAGAQCPVNIRNSVGYKQTAAPTGTSYQAPQSVGKVLVTGQPGSGNVFFQTPATPLDGQTFSVCNVTASNFSTNPVYLSPGTNQKLFGGANSITLTTLAAKTCVDLVFQLSGGVPLSGGVWYQTR